MQNAQTPNLTTNLTSGTYSAVGTLTNCASVSPSLTGCTPSTLVSGANVTLTAGSQIVLGPGFTAAATGGASLVTSVAQTLTITTAPVTGLGLTVDGAACTSPCTFSWVPGSVHTISVATSPQAGGAGVQYVNAVWSDGGAQSHSITAPGSAATYTATFTAQYYLTTAASPSSEGSISPASEWVNAGTVVAVSATANSGNQFSGFSGALSGATDPQNITMSAPATVTANFAAVPPPSITSLSPTSGAAGVQVTISGSGFGATQGSGRVWLGTSPGAVVSWSDTQIAATVSPGATSGTVQVQQGGAWSNSMPFTVSTASITSAVPASGLPGTQVTITGSGFGSAQGSGQVWLGTAIAAVQSWSDTQVVATVGSGAATGSAQILQNGVMSNAIPFSVNLPHVTGASPASGSPGTTVTITGSGFGSLQGSGAVWLGSTNGVVLSWSDTQVVATVALNALTGVVRVQQNGVWSNALAFTVPGGSSSVTLAPNLLNLAVGDVHPIQALNSSGQPVTGLTWASSDSTVVSLSTDDPPLLTAVAAGHVTITAGTASADVTVSSPPLTLGTVLWSNPGDGSGVAAIVPAVPSATGLADVFALQNDGTVQAITSDGVAAWSLAVPDAVAANGYPAWSNATAMPDFQGGLIVSDALANSGNGSIMKVDGITGLPYPTYNLASLGISGFFSGALAVHTNGTIFAFEGDSVIGINPITGTQTFSVPIPIPTPAFDPGNCSSGTSYGVANMTGFLSNFIVAGDGNAYMAFAYNEFNDCSIVKAHLRLLQLSSSGASNVLTILDAVPLASNSNFYFPDLTSLGLGMIANADTGVALTWGLDFLQGEVSFPTQYGMAITTGTSVSVMNGPILPGQEVQNGTTPVIPVLQAQDGSFVGSVTFVNDGVGQTNMVAFDQGGNVLWMVPNEQPLMATADGGVIGQSGITYGQNGNATGQVGVPNDVPDWAGQLYTAATSGVQLYYSWVSFAAGFWSAAGGNPSANAASVANLGKSEGLPLWLRAVTPTCNGTVGSIKPQLGGTTLNLYNADKQQLLSLLSTLTPASSCSIFFSGNSQLAPYLNQLSTAVSNQVPYAGPLSTLSKFAAGGWTQKDTLLPTWPLFTSSPVCTSFYRSGGNWSGTVATAQTQPPGTDVYVSTQQQAANFLTQSTILHEALHNLTGLGDDDLYLALTGLTLPAGPSYPINTALVQNGCALK